MEYSKIVSVSGLPGLYELISSKSDGAVVRSLDDKTTRFASGRIHHFSHLESIEIYTVGENVNLVEVFHAMEKAEHPMPEAKDNNLTKNYFEKVYPEIDFERVYNSDLKKMIKWYEALKRNNIEIKLTEPEPELVLEPEEKTEPAKKPAPKKEKSKPATQAKEKKVAKKTTEKAEKKTTSAKSSKPATKTPKKKEK